MKFPKSNIIFLNNINRANPRISNHLNVSLLLILRIVIKYSSPTPRYTLLEYFNIGKNSVIKIINKGVLLIPVPDFSNNKLGGPEKNIQIDETMMNYKCKSHLGRSANNKTDAICIIEFSEKIRRVFAKVIPNKKESTLIPIICSQVSANSILWTDEHRSYSNLNRYNYIHETVCHKYEFISHDNGVDTQAVESFNNIIKNEIKLRKGVSTIKRDLLLNEICFKFNNKDNLLKYS